MVRERLKRAACKRAAFLIYRVRNMVFKDLSVFEYLLGGSFRKSNAHIFVTLALLYQYGPGKIKALDCFDYMETFGL